jgi:hypothetical protein
VRVSYITNPFHNVVHSKFCIKFDFKINNGEKGNLSKWFKFDKKNKILLKEATFYLKRDGLEFNILIGFSFMCLNISLLNLINIRSAKMYGFGFIVSKN